MPERTFTMPTTLCRRGSRSLLATKYGFIRTSGFAWPSSSRTGPWSCSVRTDGPDRSTLRFSWAFVLLPQPDGTTRLVVRERYEYTRRWAALIVQPAQLISSLMSPKMLRGIKTRVEHASPNEVNFGGMVDRPGTGACR